MSRVLTFIAETSPVDNGLVNVGPFPPVATVSTRVRLPSPLTENDWRFPIGPISFVALQPISASFVQPTESLSDSLEYTGVVGMRCDPRRVLSCSGLIDER